MDNEIIIIKQLPEIEERLQEIKTAVTQRISAAMSLECTEDTVKEIKVIRAALNKEFEYWETKRKEVKGAVLLPYEQFEARYKECVTELFKTADNDLKGKINEVETKLKEERAAEIKAYFEEYLASKNITMPLTFECADIKITLSASDKSLKEQARAFVDRVCEDLSLIDTQEHKEEIYHEYNSACFLNVKRAIETVVNRHKAIEEAKAREEARREKAEAEQSAAKKVETVVEALTPPTVDKSKEVFTVNLAITGTRAQLKALKEFLISNRYVFEDGGK